MNEKAVQELLNASAQLYLAGKWECKELSEFEQARLWERLRIAAQIREDLRTYQARR